LFAVELLEAFVGARIAQFGLLFWYGGYGLGWFDAEFATMRMSKRTQMPLHTRELAKPQ